MDSNLNDYQLNINCSIQKMFYTNLMVTTNQKAVIDIQRVKRKKSKYNIRKAINHERQKEGIREKLQKQPQKRDA